MAWLEMADSGLPFGPGPAPQGASISIRAWNLMGGIDWAGLPVVAEVLGIEDVERLIVDLCAIRDYQERKDG